MPLSLYAFIWKVSGRAQLLVCLLSGLLIPLAMVPLELQRRIVDDAVSGGDLRLLVMLGLLYLATIVTQQTIKYGLNLSRGMVIEDVTRRLRNLIHLSMEAEAERSESHARPPAHNHVSQDRGSVVSMVAAEAEDVGGFVGDSISVPLVQGGTILAVLGYLAWVDIRIASFAVLLYFPQYVVVRKVQAVINRLARGHAKVVRRLGQEIVAGAGGRRASRRFEQLVDSAYALRMRIYRRKYLLTYLGNFLDAIGPLIVLTVGGWFVIRGETAVSTLVVFISGFQKVSDPWDQLINFYRTAQTTQTKYRLIVQTLQQTEQR